MKTTSLYILVVLSFLVLTGCATAPVETVVRANESLDAATEAEGHLYLPELFQAAADSIAAAEAEIAIQDARTSVVRNYDRAEAQLAFAIHSADSAAAAVPAVKEAMALANEALFLEAEAAVAQALALMNQAPRGKDGVMALASIREDLTLTTGSVQAARAAQAEGKIFEARDLAQSALDRAQSITGELGAAIQAASPTRRS